MVWPTEFDKRVADNDRMMLPRQLSAAHAYTPLDHVLKLDIAASPARQRLTGIIVTMGKSTSDLETLEKMMGAGMNVALLNMSFGTREEHVETIKMLRSASKSFGDRMGNTYPLAIAMRLSGKKIRTGRLSDTFEESVELKNGELIRLTTDETYKERCSMYIVYVDFMYFAEQIHKGDFVLLDNETIMLKVEIVTSNTVTCKIERGGLLGSHKDVFVPHVLLSIPNYSEKDKLDIEMAISNHVDILISPFVNSAADIEELRSMLGEKGKHIGIMANIQTHLGYHNFDSILQAANAIMITRQELGSDITPKKLVIAQKNMIARANTMNVPICIGTHVLGSMRNRRIPLRAELLDLANCILDGVDSLVLCAETAVGQYPIDTVIATSNACREAEACVWSKRVFYDLMDKTPIPCKETMATAMAAVLAAQTLIAAAIVVVTTSGNSAQTVAKFRPRCPIIAVTRYPSTARQLHLCRGIMPIIYEDTPDVEWPKDVKKRVNFAIKWGLDKEFIRVGDPVILVSGWKQGSGSTSTLKIEYAARECDVGING